MKKKYELFMYTDRNSSNGEYIGRTRTYQVEAENEDKAMEIGYRENSWARGCWCQEVREVEVYGVEFKCKSYGDIIISENRVFIKAKNREQARRYYNDKIKGKKFYGYRTSEIGEEGDIECREIQEIYIACALGGDYDATNY